MGLLRYYFSLMKEQALAESHRRLLSLLPAGKHARFLDVGCGDGSLTKMAAQKLETSHVFGLEISREHAEQARRVNGVEAVVGDASQRFPFESGSFDIVLANQLIEHLSDTDSFIREMRRVLRDGGICVCSTMNLAAPYNSWPLLFGWQPPTAHVSDEVICGNPLHPARKRARATYHGVNHRRIFTSVALKELFEFHGFNCESLTGWGLFPLPVAISRYMRWSRYADYITIKARKRASPENAHERS